ncbi:MULTISPECIES: glycine zipper family protein [unclassified Gordonia (in: high G+C Gram-positive bacteria)]|uniref:glycine zipper family protein n=1 Tax=unclassified Gordonia (in: high G+C Gram-positive bacteria) TaxID=2657482 RepID=UPI00196647A3|nr:MULTISPECIES: glycine zipper family protein [unclassified Gordonia (in: high G+C Gram-positive bacteria)]MBN0974068.1 glycine zipper family protein [Gordonia sp. BP-119]MBN0983883.1 glycine zipper family protein [Gordonia sp. BP-94]
MSPHRQHATSPRTRAQVFIIATISLVTAAITAFAGSAQAAPKQAPNATYDASWNADSLTLNVHNASVSTSGGALSIRDLAGTELFRMPLNYRKEYNQFPIDARQADNSVTLVPSRDLARATPVAATEVNRLRGIARHQVAAPQTKQERDDQALERLYSQVRTGMTISSLVGTILGGIVGGVLGCALTSVTLTPIGCIIVGIPVGAAAGGIVGLALGGGGTLIGAGIQYFQTINSPFRPPRG